MVSFIISRVVILVFGTLYPAYASYKAVKTRNSKEYVKWMMYWIVFALFTCVETFADIFIAWIPFYYELKILFVLWLLSPATKGASILYRKFIHPQLMKREKEIDSYIAKASDQGYTTFLNLGSKGINMATNFVLTSAMKGQTKIADHLRKSYSMNDLTDDKDGTVTYRQESMELTDDEQDEIDNRIIEESYNQEMHETSPQQVRRKKATRSHKDSGEMYTLLETQEGEDGTPKVARKGKPTYTHKDR